MNIIISWKVIKLNCDDDNIFATLDVPDDIYITKISDTSVQSL